MVYYSEIEINSEILNSDFILAVYLFYILNNIIKEILSII